MILVLYVFANCSSVFSTSTLFQWYSTLCLTQNIITLSLDFSHTKFFYEIVAYLSDSFLIQILITTIWFVRDNTILIFQPVRGAIAFDILGIICMQPGELANACTEYALLIFHTKVLKVNRLRLNLVHFVVGSSIWKNDNSDCPIKVHPLQK